MNNDEHGPGLDLHEGAAGDRSDEPTIRRSRSSRKFHLEQVQYVETASSIGRCTVPVMMTGASTSTDRWNWPTLEWLLIVAAVAGLAALAIVLVQGVVDDTAEDIPRQQRPRPSRTRRRPGRHRRGQGRPHLRQLRCW